MEKILAIEAQMQTNWLFNQWQSNTNPILPSNTSLIGNFNAISSDSVILITYPKPPLVAFISGNDTICSNSTKKAEVKISFSASVAPYTFVYSDKWSSPKCNYNKLKSVYY